MDGVIRRLVADKMYGFIKGADGVEYFFHKSGLEATGPSWYDLREQQRVAFTPIRGEKGPRAIEVRAVS